MVTLKTATATLSTFLLISSSIIILYCTSPVVLSIQPDLPTTVFGMIKRVDGSPVISVPVTAQFTDADGYIQEVSTNTLTVDQALASNSSYLAGYFFFNKGYLQAKEGTDITITVSGVTRSVVAAPGKNPVSVDPIVLGLGESKTPASGGSEALDGSNSIPGTGTGKVGGGEGSADNSLAGYTETDQERIAGGRYDGLGTLNQPGVKGEGTEGKASTGLSPDSLEQRLLDTFPKTAPTNNLPGMPTTIYGAHLDDLGNPIPGESITAEFFDEEGNHHSATTKTLTKEEAEALGDPSLEGYYAFNNGEIKARPGSQIRIKSNDVIYRPFNSKPGQTIELNLQQGRLSSPSPDSESLQMEVYNDTISDSVLVLLSMGATIRNNYLGILKFFGIFLLMIVIIFHKSLWKKYKTASERIAVKKLSKRIQSLGSITSRSLMTSKVETVSPEESANDLVRTILSENISCIVVEKYGKAAGVISEMDLLRNIDLATLDLYSLKASDVMSKPVKSIQKNLSLFDTIKFSLSENIRKIPVTEKEKLIGIVTQTDLVKALDRFFSRNEFDESNISTVGHAMTKELLYAGEDELMVDVMKQMCEYDVDAVIITKPLNGDLRDGQLVGIVTERDIINVVYNNPLMLTKLKLCHVMTQQVFSLSPGIDVIQANKMLIQKGVRRAPVIDQGAVVGIITQRDILNSLHSFLSDLISRKGKAALDIVSVSR